MRAMEIGNTGVKVSVVSMGTLSIGGDGVWGHSDETESINTIRRAVDLGITFFDTAAFYGYGRSETILGKALAADRDRFIVSSKCGLDVDTGKGSFDFMRDGHVVTRDLSPAAIRISAENSLRRLNMDHIDLLYTHWQSVEPWKIPIEETAGELNRLKQEGKIRFIGASNASLDEMKEYQKYCKLDAIQGRFSMLDWVKFDEVNDYCVQNGIMFQAYSVLERGLLTGNIDMNTEVRPGDARNEWCKWYQLDKREKVLDVLETWKPLCRKYDCTQAGLTIAWATQQAPNINVDAGARRISSIEQNARGGEITIEPDDLAAMTAAAHRLVDNYS